MNPTIFGYVVLFTVLLAGAAAAVEWGMQGRVATRHIWSAAIALALLAPPAVVEWHSFAERSAPFQSRVGSGPTTLTAIVVNSGRLGARRAGGLISRDALIRMVLPSMVAVRATLTRLNRGLTNVAATGWVLLSLTLIAWLTLGVYRWRRAQRAWERITLDGVDVHVSRLTGPAVLGILSHRIVLPAWATTMEPEHRRLILAHECEHINSHDPERLALALVALILMPWNIGMWWCAARLRRSIELDCDARVLRRFPSAREYGYVLLEVAARGRNAGPLAIPMVSLLRLRSELEMRLRAMTRNRSVGVRSAVAGGLAAVVAIAGAFTAPVPSLHRVPVSARILRANYAPVGRRALITRPVARDTTPRQRADSAALLRRHADSLYVVAREIAQRARALNAAEARLDASRTALDKQQVELRMEQNRLRMISHRLPPEPFQTYFHYQVDKAAAALPSSPVPQFPPELRKQGIGGEVAAQFIVDTAGRVVPGSIMLTRVTNELLANSVLSTLPHMRFAPAEIRGVHVKQLVQQPFVFAVTKTPK